MNPITLHADETDEIAARVALDEIGVLDQELEVHFHGRLIRQPSLTRQLVSYQDSKTRAVYRWYKYKEAFSASLVSYLLRTSGVESGRILDPFAGSGTALFAANNLGLHADGIELLPIGQEIITTKRTLETSFAPTDFDRLRYWRDMRPWRQTSTRVELPELRITRGAYPHDTQTAIEHYMGALQTESLLVQTVLRFALLCVLEKISFTRKDGQYLRWDHRSDRRQGKKPFNKGVIYQFDGAIVEKLDEILTDMSDSQQLPLTLFDDFCDEQSSRQGPKPDVRLFGGSCLEVLPTLPDGSYNAIVTSPPYCNRYDYTRTYALELAVLGIDERELLQLRQDMLSCTVENRAKDLLALNPKWDRAIAAADENQLLQRILCYLGDQNKKGLLNNTGIPRMVRGYFYEMACITAECARVLCPGAYMFMVNDNVRYAGASISVDTILSAIAEHLGFSVEKIMILPNGKGNSSQQMGIHGRTELRKCVYVWKRTLR